MIASVGSMISGRSVSVTTTLPGACIITARMMTPEKLSDCGMRNPIYPLP